jgi:hypothetical protein
LKILFITPSLESGKDGVGDYTLRLAATLKQKGAHVFCLSLADRFVSATSPVDSPLPFGNNNELETLRLSTEIPWKERLAVLQSLLDSIQPDWVSLQYVPYGFNPRGLPFGLARRLSSLRGNFRWHIMFHELWIGEEAEYSPLQRMIGFLQKRIVRNLASATRATLHTSNPTYRLRLKRADLAAEILPLFSNIPISQTVLSKQDVLKEAKMEPDLQIEDVWIFAIFGAIYPRWQAEPLFERIDQVAKRTGNRRCLLLLLGRHGANAYLERAIQACRQRNWSYLNKGELSPPVISSYLQCADFGIATSPLSLIGKSGSVAAMQEHGMPVLVSRLEDGGDGGSGSNGLILLNHAFEDNLLKATKSEITGRLETVADSFLQTLKS